MNMNDTDRETICAVIKQQLSALQRDDAEMAFSFASPEIQSKFGTSANFLLMVKVAYPAIYRPRSVVFDRLALVEGTPTQEVVLLSPDGELVKAFYQMEQQADKTWKIGGCFLIPVQSENEMI